MTFAGYRRRLDGCSQTLVHLSKTLAGCCTTLAGR